MRWGSDRKVLFASLAVAGIAVPAVTLGLTTVLEDVPRSWVIGRPRFGDVIEFHDTVIYSIVTMGEIPVDQAFTSSGVRWATYAVADGSGGAFLVDPGSNTIISRVSATDPQNGGPRHALVDYVAEGAPWLFGTSLVFGMTFQSEAPVSFPISGMDWRGTLVATAREGGEGRFVIEFLLQDLEGEPQYGYLWPHVEIEYQEGDRYPLVARVRSIGGQVSTVPIELLAEGGVSDEVPFVAPLPKPENSPRQVYGTTQLNAGGYPPGTFPFPDAIQVARSSDAFELFAAGRSRLVITYLGVGPRAQGSVGQGPVNVNLSETHSWNLVFQDPETGEALGLQVKREKTLTGSEDEVSAWAWPEGLLPEGPFNVSAPTTTLTDLAAIASRVLRLSGDFRWNLRASQAGAHPFDVFFYADEPSGANSGASIRLMPGAKLDATRGRLIYYLAPLQPHG